MLIDIIVAIGLIGLIVVTVQPGMVMAFHNLNNIERKSVGIDHCQRVVEILRCDNETNNEYFINIMKNHNKTGEYSDEKLDSANLYCQVQIVEYDEFILKFRVTTMSLDKEVSYASFVCSRILIQE